jgi:hypothetical protein
VKCGACYLCGVKFVYLGFPLAILIAQGVVLFSGCGSTSDSGDAGLPACEPACVDASDAATDGPLLADASDAVAADASPSCTTYCAKIQDFKGCPDPGCMDACLRLEMACTSANAFAQIDALLACQVGATYACSAASPPLPVTNDCATQAAAVANDCLREGGTMEAGCEEMSGSTCQECCAGLHAEGADTYNVALTHCACSGDTALCAVPCENSQCMGDAPLPGSTCATCLAAAIAPDGGCAATLAGDCAYDLQCVAYETCLGGCSAK